LSPITNRVTDIATDTIFARNHNYNPFIYHRYYRQPPDRPKKHSNFSTTRSQIPRSMKTGTVHRLSGKKKLFLGNSVSDGSFRMSKPPMARSPPIRIEGSPGAPIGPPFTLPSNHSDKNSFFDRPITDSSAAPLRRLQGGCPKKHVIFPARAGFTRKPSGSRGLFYWNCRALTRREPNLQITSNPPSFEFVCFKLFLTSFKL
jgi:hypothetical protein